MGELLGVRVVITGRLELSMVPFIVFFVLPVLARMSDHDMQVRQLASLTFSTMIKLLPLDSQEETDLPFSAELLDRRRKGLC
jgi:TATA-binding protein-associated factor